MNNILFLLGIIALCPVVASAMDCSGDKIVMKDVIGRVRAKSDARPETMAEVKRALTLRERRAQKIQQMKDVGALVASIKTDSK